MHIVTVATKNEGYFDYLKQSCERNGGKLEVLGWGQEWKGYAMKLNLMRTYLETLQDNEIVCFVDGYDVIVLQPIQKLENLFKSSGKKIIFSRDIDSSYIPFLAILLRIYFGKCNNYTINSGTYIGYVKDLKLLFKQIYEMYGTDDNNDDQQILTKMCHNNSNVGIDKDRKMFLVTNNFDKNECKIKIENKRLKFNDFYPCILHGPANYNLNTILKELGYNISNAKNRDVIHYVSNAAIFPFIVKIIIFITLMLVIYFILYYVSKH